MKSEWKEIEIEPITTPDGVLKILVVPQTVESDIVNNNEKITSFGVTFSFLKNDGSFEEVKYDGVVNIYKQKVRKLEDHADNEIGFVYEE